MRENGAGSSWTVRLAKSPTDHSVEVTFTAPAVDPTSARRTRAIELSVDGGATWAHHGHAGVHRRQLELDLARCRSGPSPAAPADDLASEGERSYVVQTRVVGFTATQRNVGAYDGLQVANTAVRVLDDDQASVVTEVAAGGLVIVEGTTAQRGRSATYLVRLSRVPLSTVTVTLTSDGQVHFGADSTALSRSITFTTANWATGQLVTVWAPKDGVVEGSHFGYITTSVSSNDTYAGAVTGAQRRRQRAARRCRGPPARRQPAARLPGQDRLRHRRRPGPLRLRQHRDQPRPRGRLGRPARRHLAAS